MVGSMTECPSLNVGVYGLGLGIIGVTKQKRGLFVFDYKARGDDDGADNLSMRFLETQCTNNLTSDAQPNVVSGFD